MNIAGREIGPDHPPYIIAEVSCNHGGSLERALELIDAAKESGADAVKFQAYMASTITIDCNRPEFTIQDGPWKGRNLYELYKSVETPYPWFTAIKLHAEKVGITWLASVFDKSAVDLMRDLDAPAIKIASFEIVDIPLIRYAAATGKPLIMSTGMASWDEVMDATSLLERMNAMFVILGCTSAYPAKVEDANLRKLLWWKDRWSLDIGISDHTIGPEIPIAATALGACIIEKHFRIYGHPTTEDTPFSLDADEFGMMVGNIRKTWAALQPPKEDSEAAQRPLRRSLFAVAYIAEGETFTETNVRSIRPGHGLPPATLDEIIGQAASRAIERGEPMAWDMVKK